MKKLFTFIAILLGVYFAQAQENSVFYYYRGEKIYLDKIENTKLIHFSKTITADQKEYILQGLKEFDYRCA